MRAKRVKQIGQLIERWEAEHDDSGADCGAMWVLAGDPAYACARFHQMLKDIGISEREYGRWDAAANPEPPGGPDHAARRWAIWLLGKCSEARHGVTGGYDPTGYHTFEWKLPGPWTLTIREFWGFCAALRCDGRDVLFVSELYHPRLHRLVRKVGDEITWAYYLSYERGDYAARYA